MMSLDSPSTFDLLHAGHIAMLREAKSQCDYLICALQIDPSIDRPEKKFTSAIYCRKICTTICSKIRG